MFSDLRFSLRQLRKSAGFALVAVFTLALGIGASIAIFSVVDAVLLRPVPYPEPHRIVELRELDEQGRSMPFADPNVDDLQRQSRSFDGIARYNAGLDAVAGGSEPVRTMACAASTDFFRVLGVKPLLGRVFASSTAEENEGVVVSYGFWKQSLGGRRDLAGATLRLEDHTFAIIGVLPVGVEFPPNVEVWFPASIYPRNNYRTAHNWSVIARLREGVSAAQAQAEIGAIGQQLKRAYRTETDATSFGLTPLRERMVRNARGLLLVLAGAVALLLVIACSNVANLLLVRTTTRRKEIALRAALGASRWQLTRQFAVETLVLTLTAAALGILLAFWSVPLLVGVYHGKLPHIGAIGVDAKVLGFALTVSLLLGLILSLVPALQVSHTNLQTGLGEAGRGAAGGRCASRTRSFLVVAQIAMTLILLIGAGLLGRSFQRLLAVNPGFQTESAVAMSVSQPYPAAPTDRRRLALVYQRLLERFHELPGVLAVGGVNSLPMTNEGANGTFIIEDGAAPPKTMDELNKEFSTLAGSGRLGDADFQVASAGYFAAMRIPLLRGRVFLESDGPDSPQVALVNQTFVRRHWPNEDPIGKQLEYGGMDGDLRLLHVVGVVADVHDAALDAQPRPMVYVDYLQRPGQAAAFAFVLRGRGKPADWISTMRREARAVDPTMPTDFRTLEQLVSSSLDDRRFSMVMVGFFAGAALLLAMVGLYGIMAYITSQRTREIGIRMALGAQRNDMLRLVIRQSFALVLTGLVLGIVGALGGTRLLGTLLYGISGTDFTTFLAVVLLLSGAALLASFIPARRAAKVDPIIALHHD